MNVLVIGGGGREHALAWKCAQSASVDKVYVAPGNAGTAHEAKVENIAVAAEDVDGLLHFAQNNGVDFTLVGPEVPLVLGVVDKFTSAGLACFGPTAAAAQLEGSKAYSKDFMTRHRIPTARYQAFTEVDKALAYLREQGAPIVVKASGLASGKGVVVAQTEAEAAAAITDMLDGHVFGDAGRQVVLEEFLVGEEASFICLVDGAHALALATSQDHKARDDGDQGPNTGGMGAYSPAPVVTAKIHQRIMDEVILPTVRGMAADGHPYVGFLYAGVMIGLDGGIKVLEFNCRLGDPETQPLMMRLRSDIVSLCQRAVGGQLVGVEVQWDARPALGVVMAAQGYPENYRKGDVIEGLDSSFSVDVKVFHAGTALKNGQVVTQGGRVLCVCGLGDDVADAQKAAYQAIRQIHWDGAFCRRDIGYRAIARKST